MRKRLSYSVIAAATFALTFSGSAAGANTDTPAHGREAYATSAIDLETAALPAIAGQATVGILGFPTPSRRSYTITSSCQPYAAAIRRGAAAWNGLTEGGGTPVNCVNGFIRDCGPGNTVVGCNYNRGQRINLYMGGVHDDALLATHELGHDWFDHSTVRCAGWGSIAEIMSPTICNLLGSPATLG